MKRSITVLVLVILLCTLSFAQTQSARRRADADRTIETKQTLAPATTGNPVVGSGTTGQIPKWLGVDGLNSFTIGNSNIFEDKFGKVGIGTLTPTSLLTVQGMIETTLGGYKFPDGSVQTTSAAGSLFVVAHNATLTGNGTQASPLGVSVPLILNGSVGSSAGFSGAIIKVTNTAAFGGGIGAVGGPGASGMFGTGGDNNNGNGGVGVVGLGGSVVGNGINTSKGGVGLNGFGGDNNGGFGGDGVGALGGSGGSGGGGFGVIARGGDSSAGSNGGGGVIATGGAGSGSGNFGGIGIEAIGGSGTNGATFGLAGRFTGDVEVLGNLSKGGGSFKIDHPLDPENQYLYHSFVESPDMMNIYNGNITTDENGEATITLPDYFEALNQDFRYQLTVIGTFAQAIVAEKMKSNRFMIKTNAPNVEVSWQVTGIRHDAFANKNRIPVEEAKPDAERGYFLYPNAFNQPEEKSINWARDPEGMRQLKQRRLEAQQKLKQLPNQR